MRYVILNCKIICNYPALWRQVPIRILLHDDMGEKNMDKKKYDVSVSYASEQRPYVERFVKQLQAHKLSVYYDRDAQAKMVGKILDQELHKIYIQESEHCVLFL